MKLLEVKEYQNLTYQKLHELILEECNKGNSRLYLPYIGFHMINYLLDKGFYIGTTDENYYIEW